MSDATLTALLIGHDKSLSRTMRSAGDEVDKTNRKLKDIGDGSERSGGKLKTLGNVASQVGKSIGEIASSFGKETLKNPYAAATAGVIALGVAMPAAAAVAGVALAGIGAGFIGLGAIALKESARVKAAGAALASELKTTLRSAAQSLEEPFVRAMDRIRGTIAGARPALTGMFADVAPAVDRLARGFDGLVRNALPGLAHAVEAAGPVLAKLGDSLPVLGAAVSDFFRSLGESGPGAVKALGVIIDYVAIGLRNVGDIIEGLSKAYDAITSNPVAEWLMDQVHAFAEGDKAAKKSAESVGTLAALQNALAGSTSNATAEFEALVVAQNAASSVALQLSGSEDAVTKSLASVSAAAKQNHASLTGNTAKSIELRDVIRSSLGSIQSHADLMMKDGANIGQVTMKRDADLRKLRDVLVARGHDKRAVESLISTMLRVPKSVFTEVKVSNAERARQQLLSVNAAARSIQRAITLTVGIRGTAAAYATLNQLSARARAGVDFTPRAAGGPVRKGQPYIVGENRPELFVPSQNGTILPRVPTSSGGGPGGGATFNITVQATPGTNGRLVGADIVRELQKFVKANGALRGITA